MALVGRDGRWEGLGRMPRMLYPGGLAQGVGIPSLPRPLLVALCPTVE